MNDYCGRFHFVQDMNGNMTFTISDVELMLKFFILLPSKVVMVFVDNSPDLIKFFEVNCSTGNAVGP